MKVSRIKILSSLITVAGFVAIILSTASLSAASVRHGTFHVIKDCSGYNGEAGSFCTITWSNLLAVPAGSKVFYFQPLVPSTGLLDSNIVLDAGNGNRAIGRCTLDLTTNLALCTFSDGTGELAGFHARVKGSGDFGNYQWRGTYHFTRNGNN